MAGQPLAGAVKALVGLLKRLDAGDNFGLVAFDDDAQIVVPAGPLTDKNAVIDQVRSIETGGMTDLGAGYLRGLQEIRRVSLTGGTLLVISDGHVNRGITDVEQLGDLSLQSKAKGIVTSTIGYGLGYDETLLSIIARGGSGNHHFAEDPDSAGAAIASEVTGLLSKSIQAASLVVRFSDDVQMLRLYNDLPATQIGDGAVMVELGDFYAEEQRKLLMRFKVPAMAALGLAQIATLELRYVELPGLVEQTVTLPVSVNVVPGDHAAGRAADPTVRTEVLFQEAQRSKRLASEALERRDLSGAKDLLDEAVRTLTEAGLSAPQDMREDLDLELGDVSTFAAEVGRTEPSRMSKRTRASFHRQSRQRGRRDPSTDQG